MIMNLTKQHFGFNQKILVLAMLAAMGPAQAADDEMAQWIKPDSTVMSAGLGLASGGGSNSQERSLFGQYNGWRKNNAGLLLNYMPVVAEPARGTA